MPAFIAPRAFRPLAFPAREGAASPWAPILALAAVDALWAARASLAVSGWAPMAGLALLMMVAGALLRRSDRWSDVGVMTDAAGAWIAFTAAACVLTYLGARGALPLRDDALDSLDRALGFDWVAWSNWVAARPAVRVVLGLAYASLLPQIALCCCVLPLTAGPDRLRELLLAALAAVLVTTAVSALLPALGEFAHHGRGAEADWLPDLLALRRPGPVSFVLQDMKGVVTMPSYHAVLAVLFAHAHRRTGATGVALAALNLAMLVSTPGEGGHYLCDVIAGCGLAAASILLVRLCTPAPRPLGARPSRMRHPQADRRALS